ncbi:MAG: phosphonate ABC transporter, permease protein PhnE [Paracoccaceae bacterium]
MQNKYFDEVRRKRTYSTIFFMIFFLLMVSGFMVADDRNAGGFWDGLNKIFDFPAEVVNEAVEKASGLPALLVKFMPSLIETINIALVSTLIGALLGAILSLAATRGFAQWPHLIPLWRRILDVMRAMPEIVIALILIFVLGGGPIPAMIAISFHTVGALGKLFSEVNENASIKPVDGLASVGANWWQKMMLGVVPQVAPNYLSYALLRFEINIRASAILGFVGAGGIGYDLKNSMSWGKGRYDEAAAIFILLFLTIVVVDQISSYYRNKLTYGVAEEVTT